MAQTTVIVLTDDLDGEDIPAGKGETIHFGLDGHHYEIDLNDENASEFKDLVDRYANAGRLIRPERNGHRPRRHRATLATDDPRSRCHYCGTLGRVSKGSWRDFQNNSSVCAKSPTGQHQPVGSANSTAPNFNPTNTPPDPRAVRVWAKAKGIAVNSHGRIPAPIVAQFRAAGN